MAAMFSNGEVDFNKAAEPQAPTKGRAIDHIDHIGPEAKGLEAFGRTLEAASVKFYTPYHTALGTGLKSALITGPVGTLVELTEGLAAE